MDKNYLTKIYNKAKYEIIKKPKYKKNYNAIIQKIKASDPEKTIYLFGTPEHGNLGDHAITKAVVTYLNDTFPSYIIIEVPLNMLFLDFDRLLSNIESSSLICINGGGWMGSVWPKNEKIIRKLIKKFDSNKIIIFPQTVYYEETKGNSFFEDSLEIYNSHNDLTVTLREKKSFDFMRVNYPNVNSYLIPDIVLYLNESKSGFVRDNILICLRTDREKSVDSKLIATIMSYFENHPNKTINTDTVINKDISVADRDTEITKKLDEFRKSKLVLTDRLHGMLFSVITNTPCIVFDNKTKKVSGVYDWVKDSPKIYFIDDVSNINVEELKIFIDKYLANSETTYFPQLGNEFDQLKLVFEEKL